MDLLSLQEPIPEPAPRLSRIDALVISLALHLLAALLLLFGSQILPARVLAFFAPRPGPSLVAPIPMPPLVQPREVPRKTMPKIPLKFAYVKIPNDTNGPKNPTAPLLSDKNRKARQEMSTPKEARNLSIDPHSVGDSFNRVKPDPSRPKGQDSPDLPKPQPGGGAGGAAGGTAATRVDEVAGPRANQGTQILPGTGPAAGRAAGGGAGVQLPRPGAGPGEGTSTEDHPDLRQVMHDIQSGEYKFTFSNPAYLNNGAYGAMSFDTQDFPWGDYARRLYVIILNNWLARIPLAAREGGMRGYVCWHFVIEKDGTISQILLVRPSSVAPLDKAASDAIRASSPVPPLPENFPEPREGVTYCFLYNVAPGEMDR